MMTAVPDIEFAAKRLGSHSTLAATPLRVVVTGATGFIGTHVVEQLARRGHRVVAMVRGEPSSFAAPDVETWTIADLATLAADSARRLAGIDAVVHCAARVHVLHETEPDPLTAFRRVNLQATLELASAAAAAGVARFVHLSTIGVNGASSGGRLFRATDAPAPANPYAQSKWEAEQALDALAARTGMAVAHLRPPMVYGPGAPGNFALLARAVRSGLPLPLGGLQAPRSFAARGNVVDLVVHLLELPRMPAGTYLTSDDEDMSTAEFVRRMAKALGRRTPLIPVPEHWLRRVAGWVGRGDQVSKMAVPLALDIKPTCLALGWTPPLSVDQALRAALNPTTLTKHP
jgi:UDP-4-keto-D-QuiNAc 4-reductase